MISSQISSRFFLTALLLSLSALTLKAQTTGATPDIPHTISYQGMLANSSDKVPLPDGNYQVTVSLYSDPNGNNPIWQDSYSTPVNGGIFNLYLGSGARQLPPSIVLNTPLWIGTSVNGGEEMRPLTPLSASPYALNVSDKAITTNKLADKAVTAEKLGTDYVSELRVNGEKVTGQGTALNIQGTPSIPLTYDAATQSLTIGRIETQTGDEEKGTSVLATNNDVWTMRGNGRSLAAGFPLVAPALGDWIGTANAVDFVIKVNGQQTMQYQQTGALAIPNIIGGQGNTVTAATSVASIIAGGTGSNITTGNYDAIGGGNGNSIQQGHYGAIGGGASNSIANGDYNADGGGLSNTISFANYTVIDGGSSNLISNGNQDVIGGGEDNRIEYGDHNMVGGGLNNQIFNPGGYAINAVTIGGGQDNKAEIDYTTIGGGSGNAIKAPNPGTTEYGTIGGGKSNEINGISYNSFIGGGEMNLISDNAPHAVISGGLNNQVTREYTTISGGQDNFIDDTSPYGIIGGGSTNHVGPNGDHSTIGGGYGNILAREYGTISGGLNNNVDINSPVGTIGGGESNAIATDGDYSTIGGGGFNSIESVFGTIAGGRGSAIDNTSDHGTIGGGRGNAITTNGDFSTIGGGEKNVTLGSYTTIPGGDQLTTTASYAQTAVGFFNNPRGAMPVHPSAATIAASNDPLFMVGNGVVSAGAPGRSNAFEVSYNGHSSVYGINGSGAVAPATTGGTYIDNVVYAWADVPLVAGGGPIPPISDFGVASIIRVGPGDYNITINVTDAAGAFLTLTQASITATIKDDALSPQGCGMITTTGIGVPGLPANTFKIRTYDLVGGSCSPTDRAFMFKVTGRP